jgi:hypothetical protein
MTFVDTNVVRWRLHLLVEGDAAVGQPRRTVVIRSEYLTAARCATHGSASLVRQQTPSQSRLPRWLCGAEPG